MSIPIGWRISIDVPGGPKRAAAGTLPLAAYDQIQVVVENGESGKEVDIQPTDGGFRLLFLTSSVYDPGLTFSIGKAQPDATKRTALDQPFLLLGAGGTSLVGGSPKSFFFYNKIADAKVDATISIIGGWNLDPPPATSP